MQILICILLGTAGGMGVWIARISNVVSYLSDSPETCMNCHVSKDYLQARGH
jgi:cytochrome c nitrite reductase small subunit